MSPLTKNYPEHISGIRINFPLPGFDSWQVKEGKIELKDNKTKFNHEQEQKPTNKKTLQQQRNTLKGITSETIKRANRRQPGLNR